MAGTPSRQELLQKGNSEDEPISLDEYDEAAAQLAKEIGEIERNDLTQDDDVDVDIQRRPRTRTAPRNVFLQATHRSVEVCRIHGIRVKIDGFVELFEPVGEWKYQFVQIKQIWVNKTTSEVLYRGLPFTRAHYTHGRIEKKRNEICQILEIQADDGRLDEEQALVDIVPGQIMMQRSLIKTNATYPAFTVDKDPNWLLPLKTQIERFEQGPLVFRWKMRVRYRDTRFRKQCKSYDSALIHLNEDDIEDQTYRVSDQDRLKAWRGVMPHRLGLFTFGDIFCGGGGASRGAEQAGFKVSFGVDVWAPACKSYKRNFPDADIHEKDVTSYYQDQNYVRVDVLHISPPCQPWSPANTRADGGKNGEKNQAALFSVDCLLEKVRPRLVTVEQTFGILHDRHADFFNGLIKQFTWRGYSIHWKEVPLVNYGLPQTRKRVIMIASAPGEKPPPFPAPTHGPGLKPFVNERQAIDRIPRNATLHDVRGARQVDAVPRSGNEPLRCTITTSGAQSTYHYSGRRGFTHREIANLQGFPWSHVFEGRTKQDVTTQIGNAFPPPVVKVLYTHLRKWLERQDGGGAPAIPTPSPHEDVQRVASVRAAATHDVYNGGLDEYEATERAMRESLWMQSRPSVFPVEHVGAQDLPVRMDRLSAAPLPQPDLPLSPADGSASSQSSTPGSDFDYLKAGLMSSQLRSSSSAASSVTLAASPEPSPSLRGKRKYDALKTDEDDGRQTDRPCKREHADEEEGEVEFLFERGAGSSGLARDVEREASVSSFVSRLRSEASVPPLKECDRALSFGNRLWKLPVTESTSKDWEL